MYNNLDRVLDLIKKTGDKAIIVPVPSTRDSDPYIIVPIEQYEQIISAKVNYAEMTEQEILNRVNREISLWKQSQRELGFNPDMDLIDSVQYEEDIYDEENEENEENEEEFDFNNENDKTRDIEDLNYEQVPPPPDLPIIDIKNSQDDFLVEPTE